MARRDRARTAAHPGRVRRYRVLARGARRPVSSTGVRRRGRLLLPARLRAGDEPPELAAVGGVPRRLGHADRGGLRPACGSVVARAPPAPLRRAASALGERRDPDLPRGRARRPPSVGVGAAAAHEGHAWHRAPVVPRAPRMALAGHRARRHGGHRRRLVRPSARAVAALGRASARQRGDAASPRHPDPARAAPGRSRAARHVGGADEPAADGGRRGMARRASPVGLRRDRRLARVLPVGRAAPRPSRAQPLP